MVWSWRHPKYQRIDLMDPSTFKLCACAWRDHSVSFAKDYLYGGDGANEAQRELLREMAHETPEFCEVAIRKLQHCSLYDDKFYYYPQTIGDAEREARPRVYP